MTYTIRSLFQAHPYHLVSPSPWPFYTCISLLTLTTTGVSTMHNYNHARIVWLIALINVVYSMSLWFRDVISEGKFKYLLLSNKSETFIKKECINAIVKNKDLSNSKFAYYITGLLEGDGHVDLPYLSNTTLNRILNPKIIFTSHINNLDLYKYIQNYLNGIGRFQCKDNTLRYIIGDIEGIKLLMKVVHNKFRTPKNKSFNDLINFMNKKYSLEIPESNLDYSDIGSNSWFAGFTEADGYFGVRIMDFKPKSETRKRSSSSNVSIRYRLDQRYLDKSNTSMKEIMEKISLFLSCNLNTYIKPDNTKILSVSVESISKIKFIIDYFDKYPLLGTKNEDYKDWVKVYNMILNKEHLTKEGKTRIKIIQSNMNSKRGNKNIKLESKMNIIVFVEILILIILASIIIDYIINVISLFNTNISLDIIHLIKDSNNIDMAKGTVEIDKVKIDGLDSATDKLRDTSLYLGGMTITARVVKTSSIPIGAKLGAIIGMGFTSLIGFKMVQNNLSTNTSQGKISASIDKLNSNITASSNKNNYVINKFIDDSSNSNNNYNMISSLDIEQLQLDFYLQIAIIYLVLLVVVFLIMKNISHLNLEFKFLEKLLYGKYIQSIMIKLFKWWGKASNIWVYIILINILICLIISTWSIYIILGHIK